MKERPGGCRVFVVSIGYVLQKTPSDKQFVHDLMEASSARTSFAVWSLNDAREARGAHVLGERPIYHRNRNRIFHASLFVDGVERKSYKPHPGHSSVRNGIEINASLMFHLRDMRKFVKQFKPDLLHITDSAGPMASLIKKLFPAIPMTITKPTVRAGESRTGSLYRYYVKKSLASADRTITFTRAAAQELRSIGVPPECITVIPWGIKLPKGGLHKDTVSSIKRRYGWRPGELFVVVSDRLGESGFYQMIEDLETLSRSNRLRFVVAIRPTRFKGEYAKLSSRAVIIENGPDDFYDLLSAADIMLSPVRSSSADSTSLLPLAWIEAMGRKTPVITMPGRGVEDLVKDGETGFVYNTIEELTTIFGRLGNNRYLQHCQNKARHIVMDRCDIDVVAQRYDDIWNELTQKSRENIQP